MATMKLRKRINLQRRLRTARTRAKIQGTANQPRLCVFRSNKFTQAQLIDDQSQRTLASASTRELLGNKELAKLSKTARAAKLGEILAERAKQLGISKIVFDRRQYRYHGRVKALADGARKGGLVF